MIERPRRLRQSAAMRGLVAETRLHAQQLRLHLRAAQIRQECVFWIAHVHR